MSLMYGKAVLSLNSTSPTNTIAAIISTPTAATRTITSAAAANISDPMRLEAMDVVVAKIISLLILTVLSVLCGLLPLRLLIHTPSLFTRSRSSIDYFLCCLRLFSGGIYLATCFLHLMPDTRDKMTAVMLNLGSRTSYAVPELLIMSGFFAVIFVEQIIQVLYVKAQESDVHRSQKKTSKTKTKAIKDSRRTFQEFQSTLDEDAGQNHKGGSDDDDDDDDEYNNVLIDEEDDLSFKEADSDAKSVDSVTQVKENLIEQKSDADRTAASRNIHHIQLIPTHCNNVIKSHSTQQNQITKHSKPCAYHEMSNHVSSNTSRSSLDALSKISNSEVIPYPNLGPAVITAQVQSRCILNTFKQNNHVHKLQSNHVHYHHPQSNHHQNKQYPNQDHYPIVRSSSSPPPQHPQASFHQVQQQQQIIQQKHPQRDSPISHSDLQYPTVVHSSDEDSEDDEDEESDSHNNTCRVSVCLEGVNGALGDAVAQQPEETCQDKCTFTEPRTCTQNSSREVSFDRISETSSVPQEIQVKQVVDELSRTGDSSRAHFRTIIYIMALSFHGIFEGMALGLQSMKSSAWSLCFAIVVHRCVLAFKLGMDLCRGEEKQGTTFVCIGMFTLISTLGIIIGILISSGASFYSDVSVPEAILQSLATGTIFYIVFFDILFKDLEGKEYLKRVSCSFVGFSLMAIVFAITRS